MVLAHAWYLVQMTWIETYIFIVMEYYQCSLFLNELFRNWSRLRRIKNQVGLYLHSFVTKIFQILGLFCDDFAKFVSAQKFVFGRNWVHICFFVILNALHEKKKHIEFDFFYGSFCHL